MDDKVFIFFILIPGGVTLINYLCLRKTKSGRRLFYVFTSLIVAYIIVMKILTSVNPQLFEGITGTLEIMFYWYLLMVVTLFISGIFALVSLVEKRSGSAE